MVTMLCTRHSLEVGPPTEDDRSRIIALGRSRAPGTTRGSLCAPQRRDSTTVLIVTITSVASLCAATSVSVGGIVVEPFVAVVDPLPVRAEGSTEDFDPSNLGRALSYG
jgi:hypothetical protein